MSGMVIFGEDWGRHPSSTQHLAQGFAETQPVIWVNSLGLRRPRTSDAKRLMTKARSAFSLGSGKRDAQPHPFAALVQPRALPFPGNRIAGAVNGHLLERQLQPLLHKNGMRRPVLWTSLPTALPLIGRLKERALVYYAGDDFGALAGVDHGPVLHMERQLAAKADLILAASPLIAERFDRAKTAVLPHGVDAALFSAPVPRNPALPSGRPIAGFYGSLNEWIDVGALAQAAAALPGWTFMLVGRSETDVSSLKALANVIFHPPVPHAALPSFSRHWDVSLLPFRRNRQIEASNPLKLREYLAAGRPIAASWLFPALEPYADLASIAGDGPLSAAIEAASRDGSRNPARQASVAGESWTARVRQAQELIDAL